MTERDTEIMTDVMNFSNPLPRNSTPAPCKFEATNQMTRIFKSEKNNPRVIQLIGKVKNLITGTTVQLRRVKRNTNSAAEDNELISKLGRS
jgi:hypothetical protein